MSSVRYIPSLDTPRLTLREMLPTDVHGLASYLVQPRYQKYVAHRLKDDHEVMAFVKRNVGSQGDFRRRIFHVVAEHRNAGPGTVVGDGFVIVHQDSTHEIGWGVDPDLWRQGYGNEIGHALLAMSFENLKAEETWCKVMSGNAASTSLARRIGMKLDKTLQNYVVSGTRRETVEVYRMSASQYFEQPY
jgi:[ribosomal protein S5]-alanine N-acetyltransferase